MREKGIIFLLAFAAWLPGQALSQITGDYVATKISTDSTYPKDNYLEYGERLARLLSQYTPAQLAYIFQTPTTVLTSPPPPTLNEQLDLEEIGFAYGSTQLTDGAKVELDKVFDFLIANPDTYILIEGHSGAPGQVISEARAAKAAKYLIDKGIPEKFINSVGLSDSEPLPGASVGDGINRRIEIEVL